MSDAQTPSNGAAPTNGTRPARKAAPKAKPEAPSFAPTAEADADKAREKLIAVATHRAQARRELAQRWAREQAAVASQAVQSRPVTALGFALGIGVLIGLLAAQ